MQETHRLEVRRGEDAGWEIWSGSERVARTAEPGSVLPLLEEELANLVHLSSAARGRAVLHAAGFVLDGETILALGDSGAGKSTLAFAAIRRGAALLSDEWLITDGDRLWGVARAIQFEPHPARSPLPPWLDGVAALEAGLNGRDGRPLVLPHVPVERVCGPVPTAGVRLVLLARGAATHLERADPVDALAALLEAQRVRQSFPWERLLRRASRLTWSDGPAGLSALLAAGATG